MGIEFNLLQEKSDSKSVIANAVSDEYGSLKFFKIPVGHYFVELSDKLKQSIELESNRQAVEVGHDNSILENFQVKSFSIVGSIGQVGKRTFTVNPNQQVAINVGVATEEDLKLNTFAHCAPAAAASENPSETFARLGMRSSKDGKAFDLDRQLQLVNNSSSEINLSK